MDNYQLLIAIGTLAMITMQCWDSMGYGYFPFKMRIVPFAVAVVFVFVLYFVECARAWLRDGTAPEPFGQLDDTYSGE